MNKQDYLNNKNSHNTDDVCNPTSINYDMALTEPNYHINESSLPNVIEIDNNEF